ncbi:MAG: alpha/beta fold hydrolase [Acidobacteriota bacterium]
MKTSALLGLVLGAALLHAADYPAPVESDWVVRDFRFHTGEALPELRLHYTTVGVRSGEPVLLLHGTNGNGGAFLRPEFAGELFGPGQPLDAATHFIILPDAIGAGKSSKPSDGLRTRFPQYNYDDMVQAQYRLVKEHLGVGHLRLVLGTSMGGMLVWIWGEKYPDFMDALVPTAAQPTAMSGRNWMMRRMVVDLIRNDPAWDSGNYKQQPHSLKLAQVYFGAATSGGTPAVYRAAPTREKADQILDQRLAQPSNADANDVIYQMEGSRDYDPAPLLETIQARVLAINSADDERNPAELGIMEREMKRVKQGRYVLIPTGPETRGHGTMGLAKLWKQYLAELLQPPVQASK